MSWKALPTVFTGFLTICAFFLLGAGYCLAQNTKTKARGWQPGDKQADKSATEKRFSGASQYRGEGWLILDGELIPGPYEVLARDSIVTVNDIPVLFRPPRANKTRRMITSSVTHEINKALSDSVKLWHLRDEAEFVPELALQFMLDHPLVDTAHLANDDLRYRFHAQQYEEMVHIQSPPRQATKMTEPRGDRFEWYAQRLQGLLNLGSLVIKRSGGGGHTARPYPQSTLVMEQLRKIILSTADIRKREDAILEIIHNEKNARLIAERFKLK